MPDLIFCFLTSLILTYFAIPIIIRIAKEKKLFDVPDERKAHATVVPTLGGVAMFAGILFSIVIWTPLDFFDDLQYFIAALIVVFIIGAKDDIDPISPVIKIGGQLFAAFVLVELADTRLTSLYGIFGIYELSAIPSLLLSVFTVIVIINAFNLIDGINGLSASLGILISTSFGIWFYMTGQFQLATLAFALTGATIAFLKYNITPARIFMGDTGAMLVGIISAGLAIQFIELQHHLTDEALLFHAAPAVAIGLLIIPLFDLLRVFILRIAKGRSPLSPDRSHVHHLLLEIGMNHMQATATLVLVNVAFILVVALLDHLGNMMLLLIILSLALAFTGILTFALRRKKTRT